MGFSLLRRAAGVFGICCSTWHLYSYFFVICFYCRFEYVEGALSWKVLLLWTTSTLATVSVIFANHNLLLVECDGMLKIWMILIPMAIFVQVTCVVATLYMNSGITAELENVDMARVKQHGLPPRSRSDEVVTLSILASTSSVYNVVALVFSVITYVYFWNRLRQTEML